VLYRGNVFVGGSSVPEGTADPVNNVEMVLLPSPEPGEWSVTVVGAAVNQDRQGYALVATGDVATVPGGSLRYAGHVADDAAPFGNEDGVVDPGETIILPVSLFNLRDAGVTGVSARLSTPRPDLVSVLDDEASYPDIGPGETAPSSAPHFRIAVPPATPCGTRLPFELLATHTEGSTGSEFEVVVGRTSFDRSAADTPLALPPFAGTPTVSTIVVDGAFAIADLLVELHLSHADVGQVVVELTSPGGTTVRLHDRSGSGTADIHAVYDIDRDPDGPGSMASFDGELAQGTWTLSVLDDVIGGFPPTPGGTLESWGLRFESADAAVCTPLVCIDDPVPPDVGPTLRLDPVSGTDIEFRWTAIDGASAYRVWRSATPDFAVPQVVGETGATSLSAPGALTGPGDWYHLVRAVNSCNQEGP
jgi:subtilisin-like proprotein convertase family protein